MKEKNYRKLMEAFSGIEITSEELKTIEWLSGWETETIDNIYNLVQKVHLKNC
ncbi:MAG: hypothetical protein ACOCRX_11910 [Candidatus Woesearchaeota archaeon]